jgi:hypothetical protein
MKPSTGAAVRNRRNAVRDQLECLSAIDWNCCPRSLECCNQSDAWKAAHPESKAKPASIHAKASAFFKQDKVRLRIVELQVKVEDKVVGDAALSLEEHMAKLREMRDKAISLNQMGAAIKAEQLRGELRRFYVKQVESGDVGEFARMSDEELRAFVYGDQSREGETKH